MSQRASAFLALIPLMVCFGFVCVYATPTPLTDEWLFLRGAMNLSRGQEIGYGVSHGLVWKIYDHVVIVPFLIYLLVAFLSGFDNRALVLVTIGCYASLWWMFRRRQDPNPIVLFLLSLLLFNTARYMDFLWGFEFVLAVSNLLGVAGLHWLDSLTRDDPASKRAAKTASAVLLFVGSILSSAGGIFAFVAGGVLLLLKDLDHRTRIVALGSVGIAGGTLFLLTQSGLPSPHVGAREGLVVFTALGASIWSSPESLTTFRVDFRSVTGALVLGVAAIAFLRAARVNRLDYVAFPLALVVFGVAATLAIAMKRGYLGNWHLQYAVLGVSGALLACSSVWKQTRRRFDRGLLTLACALVALCTLGSRVAFEKEGPSFHAYVHSIESYIRSYESRPHQKKPFPPTGGWDIDGAMIQFLRQKHHPLFR